MTTQHVKLPDIYRIHLDEQLGQIRQLAETSRTIEATIVPDLSVDKAFLIRPTSGESEIISIYSENPPPTTHSQILYSPKLELREGANPIDLTSSYWKSHPRLIATNSKMSAYLRNVEDVRSSWISTFKYKVEDTIANTPGLRPPQLGALHAIQAHWSISKDPATVVLPTGVGKTETMISTFVCERCPLLLVVVPTDPLREQLFQKFMTLGVLRSADIGVIDCKAQYPVVGKLLHLTTSEESLEQFCRKCNVVITTMPLAIGLEKKIQEKLSSLCSTLFVDEAHHIGAPKWREFRERFYDSKIVQFTATPFRNDDEPVGGNRIFTYSLKKAQEDGYFTKIQFLPVMEFDPQKKDLAIVESAIAQLKKDLTKGHILMARVSTMKRANEVYELYKMYQEYNPILMHSGVGSKSERERIRQRLLTGESRIVVCVDMLGEGFDLPELKIAAFHDVRKSLAITLQLAGRFTRTKPNLGDATFIANIADVEVKEELRRLYRHDSDWNTVLPLISENAGNYEVNLWDFIRGFSALPDGLALQNVRPATSTVVYQTKCKQWTPENFKSGIPGFSSLERVYHSINYEKSTLVLVSTKRTNVDWAHVDAIHNWDWQLYVLHWSRDKNLLFIHNSSNAGVFKNLAQSVAGNDVRLIEGPAIFKCLAGINRLKLQNVGLREQLGRLIRYTMRAGSDVESGITETQKRKAIKSNVFGLGYENGRKVSIGCSYKGRIWSYKTSSLLELIEWSENVGIKLCDPTIDPEQVLKGTVVTKIVSSRPRGVPIAIEWPDLFFRKQESYFRLDIQGEESYLHDVSIDLTNRSEVGALNFVIFSDSKKADFEIEFNGSTSAPDFKIVAKQPRRSTISEGSRMTELSEFLTENPPTIWFADGSSLTGIEFSPRMRSPEPFDRSRIIAWDWKGTSIRTESQGISKDKASIQYKVIEYLRQRAFPVIVDDDDAGEAADVVAIREESNKVSVEFWHCKFSSEDKPGRRIKELYELCGQAQKCIRWLEKPSDLISHLLRRRDRKRQGITYSRLESGSLNDLVRIRDKLGSQALELKVSIVQPGLSRVKASQEQLELLAVTEGYLLETFKVPLDVVGSA